MDIKGAITAMITPFKEGEVDYDGLKANIRFQIDEGIHGLLALGTTAETPTITEDEREKIIKLFVKECQGKVPLMVGTGSNSTQHTIELTRQAKELGADMALVVTPYYNKPTQEGIFRHFEAVTAAVDIPVVVYNIAGRTGRNIETGTLKRIADLPNIVAVKEASGNLSQMSDVIHQIAREKEGFTVMSGDDGLTVPLMALGGRGIISVVTNLVPGKVVKMVEAGLEGDFKTAREIHFELVPLVHAVFIEINPVPMKRAMTLCGMAAGNPRLPLVPLQPASEEMLQDVLKSMGMI